MSNYCILNIKTYSTTADIIKVTNENTRKKLYDNIDQKRTRYNQILQGDYNIYKQYKNALKAKYYTEPDKKGRYHKKPNVKAIGIVLTYSPDAHLERDKNAFNKWINENTDFINKTFQGAKINMILHLDETTPHIHCMIIPTTKTGKINKSAFIRTKSDLIHLQDAYADAMKVFGLQRGEHTPQRDETPEAKIGALINENNKLKRDIIELKKQLNNSIKQLEEKYNIKQIEADIFDR